MTHTEQCREELLLKRFAQALAGHQLERDLRPVLMEKEFGHDNGGAASGRGRHRRARAGAAQRRSGCQSTVVREPLEPRTPP